MRVQDAYDRLKAEIRANVLPPGFQATEPEIAQRLEMSRTPVREALIRLEAEGLITLVPRRGVCVKPIRPDDMREIYDVLTALEPDAAARLAARGPSEAELAPLERATQQMEEALLREDLDGWARADDAFHLALLDAQGNGRLARIVATLLDQAHRARIVTLRLRQLPDRSTREHRDILSALRRGDAEATRRLFRAHRMRAADELMKCLETYQLSQL
ncbi:GntR family transcriptional regulator [Primorskyibacter sp. S187A]|uniref:GntR family transcriptional regulator n=1 Tax=Primorskyibacter sp. S187A TaxID=3415130 RepID=UPI003C7A9FEF